MAANGDRVIIPFEVRLTDVSKVLLGLTIASLFGVFVACLVPDKTQTFSSVWKDPLTPLAAAWVMAIIFILASSVMIFLLCCRPPKFAQPVNLAVQLLLVLCLSILTTAMSSMEHNLDRDLRALKVPQRAAAIGCAQAALAISIASALFALSQTLWMWCVMSEFRRENGYDDDDEDAIVEA